MGDLILPLAALGLIVGLFFLVFGSFYARRRVLTRGIGSFACSLRDDPDSHRTGGWSHGVARYEQDRLDWFELFALSLRPARSLTRHALVIIERRAPELIDAATLVPDWVLVRCSYGPTTMELAMSEPAYNGLATWLESAPPGQHINVA
jgi:Protein of unknown function (DUF2550)